MASSILALPVILAFVFSDVASSLALSNVLSPVQAQLPSSGDVAAYSTRETALLRRTAQTMSTLPFIEELLIEDSIASFRPGKEGQTQTMTTTLHSRERDMTILGGGFALGICVTLLGVAMANRFHGPALASSEKTTVKQVEEDVRPPSDEIVRNSSTMSSATQELVEAEYSESLDCFWPRTCVLAVMLMVQSLSSLVLFMFRDLIREFPELVYFLTMLVGLGGNAGGQSVVLAVRQLAFGKEVDWKRQVWIGLCMGFVLAPVAYTRAVIVMPGEHRVSLVIGLSVLVICTCGCTLGTLMPILANKLEVDPGHTSPIVQVLMDMVGIFCVCMIGRILLDWFP